MSVEAGSPQIPWRNKLSRRELLATKDPVTGKVIISSSSLSTNQPGSQEQYEFNKPDTQESPITGIIYQDDGDLAKAAR